MSDYPAPTALTLGAPFGTDIVLVEVAGGLPRLAWCGPVQPGLSPRDVARAIGTDTVASSVRHGTGRSVSVLPEISDSWFGQPGLRGHRLRRGGTEAGVDWSPAFLTRAITSTAGSGNAAGSGNPAGSDNAAGSVNEAGIRIEGTDAARGLDLVTEYQSVPGGAMRGRHTVINRHRETYVVDGLDVTIPVVDRAEEILDLTGRWGRERSPQRHRIRDGVWLREGRNGKTGAESPTVLTVGTSGFGFRHGEVWGVHLAWSGNSRYFLERLASGLTVLGAGELLLPGEIALAEGESYSTPWIFFAASTEGLDGVAAQFHGYLRSLAAHPVSPRPVTGNVWEAVYFDHKLDRLTQLADQAAEIGIERFVLDDGWFGDRRHDHAGLGDWVVSADAWPNGLTPIVDHVRKLGMQFGLWFEPEMVNADSALYRAHPEWVLGVQDRPLREFRNQLVLDLGRSEVRDYLFDQIDAVLSDHPIRYVKWDHNRSLAEGASAARHGAPGVHEQTLGFYALLDRLRGAHPDVEWESCASGGGRIDLGVLERTERVWTSDMTDALSRQQIQRWTGQLVAPEYLGAHVSAETNHQTGRRLSLDFRAATAFFGDFGVEWDITSASESERARLGEWIALYKRHRPLLHSGRTVRVDSTDEAFWMYGVQAQDRSEAVMAYVQLDEAMHDPLPFLVPGLDPLASYQARQISPSQPRFNPPNEVEAGDDEWRGEKMVLTGAVLAFLGLPAPRRWPLSSMLVHLQRL